MTPTMSFRHPLQTPCLQDVFQFISNSRRSWKTLRGGEAVWPPELETALFEGLENYQADKRCRETRLLGRFPLRNRFISQWIFEKTGKRRTPKQIGSRLQQLKDTSTGKRLLALISLNQYQPVSLVFPEVHHADDYRAYDLPSFRCESDSSSDSSESPPTTPINSETYDLLRDLVRYLGIEGREDEMPGTIVYIDLLRPDSSITAVDSPFNTSWTSLSQVAEEYGYKIIRATQHPRHLCDIDPTITLLSHSITNACSYFMVYSEDRLIFSESTTLELVDSTTSEVDGILYKTSLVPGLWEHISESSDASQFTIIQRVIQDSETSAPSTSPPIFSAIYKFLYPKSSPAEQNFSILPTEQTSDFSLETLVSIEADAYPQAEMIDFAKSPNIFDLNFTLGQDSLSLRGSPTEFSSPFYYPESISDLILDEDEQLLSSASSFDGIDISDYP